MKQTLFLFYSVLLSLGLVAQEKFYIEPSLGFFVGYSKEDRSVNQFQNLINHYYFGGKDLSVGLKLSYIKNKHKLSLGYETSYYASNFKHLESGLPRVDSRFSSSIGPVNSIFAEYANSALKLFVKLPKFLHKKSSGSETLYLINSKISPLFGLEFRYFSKGALDENNRAYFQNVGFRTSRGNYIADSTKYLQLYSKSNLTMRSGILWEFYNNDKHLCTLTILYKFAFKDAGFIRYRFISTENNPNNPPFLYQNTTRGNGFLIALGVPIKLFTILKKN
jgi:hypothetical protein